jgi:hypothetical protein
MAVTGPRRGATTQIGIAAPTRFFTMSNFFFLYYFFYAQTDKSFCGVTAKFGFTLVF